MATFAALADRAEHQAYFRLRIAGIPYQYTTIKGLSVSGYTCFAYLQRNSIAEKPDVWQVKQGKGSGGSLSFCLVNADDHFNGLLATDLASMHQTRLTADMAYSDSAGETIHVESTTGFAGAGTLYIGLETCTYTGTTATTFTGVQRAAFGSWGQRHEIVGASEPESYRNPVVTDQPVEWTGRWVSLYQGLLDEHGHGPSDGAQLVWRGILQEPQWGEGGLTVTWQALSLLTLLDREICSEPIETYTPYTGDVVDYYGDNGVKDWFAFYYLDKAVEVSIQYLAAGASDPVTITSTIPAGVYSDVDEIIGCKAIRDDHGFGVYGKVITDTDGQRVKVWNHAEDTGADCYIQRWTLPQGIAEALGFPGYILMDLAHGAEVVGEEPPSLSYHSATTRKIYVDSITSIDVPTLCNGFNNCCVIETDLGDGPIWEVVRVTGTGTDGPGDPAPGQDYITTGNRGRGFDQYAGVGRPIWSVPDVGRPKVKRCIYMKNVNYITALLRLMLSTDGTGYNGTYDALPAGLGAAIPAAFLRAADWARSAETGQLRNLLIATPLKIWDLLSEECRLLGLQVYVTGGAIGIRRIGEIAPSESVRTYGAGHLKGLAPRIIRDAGQQIGSVLWSCNYLGATDEWGIEEVSFKSSRAISFQRPASEISIGHHGYWSSDGTLADVDRTLTDLFARFDLPPCTLELIVPYQYAWDVAVGDTITLTHDRLVSPYSSVRGVSGLRVYVMAAEHNWKNYTVRLLCWVPRLAATSAAIAPSARVKSFTAHPGGYDEVELYTDIYSANDLTYFRESGIKLKILQAGDESVTYEGVSAGLSGASLLFSNPVVIGGGDPVAGDIVRYVDYADAALAASQLLFAAISDYTTELIAGAKSAYIYG
jgi:hypothetical protein